MFRLWRRLVYAIGDWVTADRKPYCMEPEYRRIVKDLEPGDVILHRDERFGPTCWFIGGQMVHAGLYIGNGTVIEAISEGVKKRDVGKILEADYTIVVRPQLNLVHPFDRNVVIPNALYKANEIVGLPYDPMFDFCDSEELDRIRKVKRGQPVDDVSFCCTEIPYYCYSQWRDRFNLYRRRNTSVFVKLLKVLGLHPGEAVIDADMYVTAPGFRVVWCSARATPEWAAKVGASEAFIAKIMPYWNMHRITGDSLIGVEFGAS